MASNKKLSATITIGGAVASSLKSTFGTVKGQINQVGSALRDLERQQRKLGEGIQTFGRMGKNVDGMRERYTLLTQQVDKLRAAYQRLNQVQKAQEANLARRAELRGQIFDAVALGATAATPIVMAAKFETAMLGVAKQVDGARDSTGKLTQVYFDMGRQIQMLGREIPIATNELAAMVAAGARMGVAKDELIGFTRTAAMMADAFELPASELADSMGKIAGLFKIPIPEIGKLADSINFLDDNAISKGQDIIEFMTRVGGVASSVKITGQEMAALGSTLLTLGERTETAGTAVNAMLSKLAAADKGTKKFKAAMQEIGLSTREVQEGMQKDATGTLLKVMDAVAKLPKAKQLGVMVELVGLEHSDTLAKLANNTEEFRKQLEMANSEAAKGSMSREFQARLQTTNAQWQLMKNNVEELAVSIGSVLLPAVNGVFQSITPVVNVMADFARDHPKVTRAVVGTAVALTTLKVSTMAAGYAFTFIKGGVLQLAEAFAKLRAGSAMATSAVESSGAIAATGVPGAVADAWGTVSETLGQVKESYENFSGVVDASKGVWQGAVAGWNDNTGALNRLRGAAMGAAAAFPAVGSALNAVKLALISTGIGALVVGIAVAGLLIYQNWEGVKAFMVGTFEGIRAGLQPTMDTFAAFWEVLKPFHPIFDTIGSGLKTAWEWFTNLLDPVKYTSEELGRAGEAGKTFGEAMAAGINFMLTPLTTLISGITWVVNNIDAMTAKAVEFTNVFGNGWDAALQGTKRFFGIGDNQTNGPAPSSGGVVPALPAPAMATVRGGGNSYQDNSQTTINLTQQPGEDSRAFARRIDEELARQRQVRQRGLMLDGAPAQ